MRHAGVGWPNGAVTGGNQRILSLPSPEILMLSTEGRYHHDEAIRAGKRVVWRAIPRRGRRPAELGWSPARFVAETINLTDAPSLPITDFIPWNELDLQDERGDRDDDWSNLDQRYSLIGGWALSVVQSLRQWSPGTRIHWPAWTPDHHALEHLDRWRSAAEACDVIDCLVADQRVTARGVTAATMRRYEGDVIVIETASSKQATVTPNHPILTRQGWLPAHLVNEGSEIAEYTVANAGSRRTNDIDVPAPISEVFRSLNLIHPLLAARGSTQDFHGDGRHGDVHVVSADRLLGDALTEAGQHVGFPHAQMRHALLSRQSSLLSLGRRTRASSWSRTVVGSNAGAHRFGDPFGLVGPILGPRPLSITGPSHRPSTTAKERLYARGVPAETFGDVKRRLAGQVTTVRVINVDRRHYSGHVYNLSTENGLIVADGIVTHNCHAYDSLANIEREYHRYRDAFPSMPLMLTEWHCKGDLQEEWRVLSWLAETMQADPLFEAAHFFIWRWWDHPGWWDDDWDIEHRPDREALFRDPPVVEPEKPVEPEPTMPDPFEHWSAETIASAAGCPVEAVREHWPKLVEQLSHCGLNERPIQIAMIGTVAIESASTFAPVTEAFWLDDAWRYANLRYAPFWGRGYIQLTWESNYRTYGPKIAELWQTDPNQPDFDLVGNPDLALNPDIAAAVAALYFRDHGEGAIPVAARRGDWREVRRLVQGGSAGLDRLVSIAALLEDRPVGLPDVAGYVFPVEGYTGEINLHWGSFAGGTDIFAPQGTPVKAIHAGEVVYRVEWNAIGGNAMQISGDDGLQSYYAHGDRPPSVTSGQRVEAGTFLFGVGDSGNAAGRGHHLHFGMGRTILVGSGPTGGAGSDFDAVTFLRQLQAAAQRPDDLLAQLQNLEGNAYHDDGVVIPVLSDAIREQSWSKVESVIKFLRDNDPHRAA